MTTRADASSLESFLEVERANVDRALERALDDLLPRLPEPIRGPAAHGVRAGGKRLRPVLCVSAYRACGVGNAVHGEDPIYDLAVSLELVHAYSLMHDDLPCMDDAELRRGRPTPHTVFGEVATMVSGAALIPLAVLWAWSATERLGLPSDERRRAVRVLTHASGMEGMVGGQALDLVAEGRALSRDALDRLHGMKTGALLTASLRMGGVAARADAAIDSALEGFGAAVGLAFQIADDVLDATADPDTLGKIPSDETHRKATYVGLLGVDGARAEARGRVEDAIAVLRGSGIRSAELEGLARYVVGRDR